MAKRGVYGWDTTVFTDNVFNEILKNAMRKRVSKRKVFYNGKNLLTIQKSWVEKESIEIYNKMKEFMHPDDISYTKIQQNFLKKRLLKKVLPITLTSSKM